MRGGRGVVDLWGREGGAYRISREKGRKKA